MKTGMAIVALCVCLWAADTKSDVSNDIKGDTLTVQGTYATPTPILIQEDTAIASDIIGADRKFSEALKRNIDKEQVAQVTK